MSTNKTFARAATLIMIVGLLSRVLGFAREQVMAAKFGLTGITDAYFAAFTVPDILYNMLVGGALSAAFIPVFSDYLSKNREDEAWKVASIVINIVTVFSILGTIIGIIFAPKLLPLVAVGLSDSSKLLAVNLSRIIFISVIFTAFNGIQMGILNSYHHFKAPAIGSLLYGVGVIGVGVALLPVYHTPQQQIKGFAFGVIAGVVMSFLVQMPELIRRGFLRGYRFNFNIFHPGVRRIFVLMIPVMLALSVNQINLVINQDIASTLKAGSISALRLANRVMMLPLGIFGSAIAVAIFPSLTTFAVKKEMDEFKNTTSLGIRATFLAIIPASVGLIALGYPLVRVMFEHGMVTHTGAMKTSEILAFYALGIFAQAATLVVIRSFYALQDTWTPLTFGVITIALNYFLNITLVKPFGASGLALAYSITGLFDFISLTFLLRRKIGPIRLTKIVTTFVKVVVASLVMGVAAYYTAGLLENMLNMNLIMNQLIQVLISIAVAIVVYVVIVLALKMEEAQVVLGMLKRKFT